MRAAACALLLLLLLLVLACTHAGLARVQLLPSFHFVLRRILLGRCCLCSVPAGGCAQVSLIP
jgi:hypothetical protein